MHKYQIILLLTMAHVYHQQIDNTIKENKLYRFNEELVETIDNQRIKMLNEIIQLLSSFKNTQQINEEKLHEHLRILKEEQYKKKWQFLNKDQRINRLEDFIAKNNFNDSISKKLIELFENGTIVSKHIKYDHAKSIITDVSLLKLVDGNFQIVENPPPALRAKIHTKLINTTNDKNEEKTIKSTKTIKHVEDQEESNVKSKPSKKQVKTKKNQSE